ncbi:hypothetical protein ADK61_08680 [Streptomyces sp. XY66]|uniref:hypothetical protein n=1 Tax=Streptomyces sp. XY66 TaxID=1415563 RepID=UPI0006AE30A1|nr:hypothetical protein [Streptomyces sp. XY66]KOU81117.1 hypothetical protein ADK61_08680 [Streptomyces sp. XY66]
MARKKLITLKGGRSAHRACGPSAVGRPRVAPSPGAAPAATALAKQQKPKQKPMSRAELLKRIEELRAQDARKKAAARPQPRSPQPKAKPKPKPAATTKAKAAPRPGAGAARRPTAPQPYYGVEMKSVGGRWVQMHPESE